MKASQANSVIHNNEYGNEPALQTEQLSGTQRLLEATMHMEHLVFIKIYKKCCFHKCFHKTQK